MENTFVEWRVPQAALDWEYETRGEENKVNARRSALLFLRLFPVTLSFIVSILFVVLPERLDLEFFGLLLFGYTSMCVIISAFHLIRRRDNERVGVYFRMDERGIEQRRGSHRVRTPWKDLGRWEKRVTAHPGVPGLMAVELSIPFRGGTIRRYWSFDPNETDANQIAFLLRRGGDTA